MFANAYRERGAPAFGADDFLPHWRSDEPILTDEEEWRRMNASFEAMNTLAENLGIH